jgi:CubicO group peptidase (beta-lactamase class C family)
MRSIVTLTRSFGAAVVAGLLLSAAVAATQGPGAKPAAAPAAETARKLVAAINSGDAAARTAFITSSFGADRVDEQLARFERIFAQTGGLEIVSLDAGRRPDDALMTLKPRKGDFSVRMVTYGVPGQPARLEDFALRAMVEPLAFTWPESKMDEAAALREVDKRVDQLAANDRFSGTVMIARGDRVAFSKAVGLADRAFGAKNELDTKYNLGSMNKMFTAVSIAQLVEAGKLSFDDTLAKVMPEYPNQEIARKVTIHQMLTHTSGLGNIFKPEFFREREKFKNARDYFAICANDPLQFEPGTDWSYSNYGFVVLGAIVEKVSGQNYYDYVREHIFEPAGMKSTASYAVDEPTPGMATGYTRLHDGDPLGLDARRTNVMSLPWRGSAAGGGYSTAPDLLAFARALRSGKILSREMAERVTSAKVDAKFGPNLRYGYGFISERMSERDVRGHGGGAPGINSDLKIFWDGDMTVVVMGNYDPPAAQNLAGEIAGFLARQ